MTVPTLEVSMINSRMPVATISGLGGKKEGGREGKEGGREGGREGGSTAAHGNNIPCSI